MSRLRRPLAALVALAAAAFLAACTGAGDQLEVTATFPSSANLFVGSQVRVLGLPVGEVAAIRPLGDVVEVDLALDPERDFPAGVRANLRPVSLLGERTVQLDPPYTNGPRLADGAAIPLERTSVPAEVDEVLRSFENFLRSLDENTLADLIDTLSATLEGNGAGINELIGDGAQTVRILSDSSVDLNGLVNELATLNETVALREDRLDETLGNLSVVLRTLVEDRDDVIGTVAELQRALAELQPLVTEHADPLVTDLQVLATTLSTVERNLDRLGQTFRGARLLFDGTGRAVDYEDGLLRLDNEAGPLTDALEDRLVDRLVGLCLRLGVDLCSTEEFFEPLLPDLCIPGLLCGEGQATFAAAMSDMLEAMPPEVADTLAAEAAAAAQAAEAAEATETSEAASGPAPLPAPPEIPDATAPDAEGLLPVLPLPDPRLGEDGLFVPQLSGSLLGGEE